MTLSRIVAPVALAVSALVGGCYSPQPSFSEDVALPAYAEGDAEAAKQVNEEIMARDRVPNATDYWFLLPRSGPTFRALPRPNQDSLNSLWTRYHTEIGASGTISSKTRELIESSAASSRTALVVSFDQICTNPTPEMNGQLESFDARRSSDSLIYNQNLRAMADEWSRIWLMERPGGTPYNTVNTSGRF